MARPWFLNDGLSPTIAKNVNGTVSHLKTAMLWSFIMILNIELRLQAIKLGRMGVLAVKTAFSSCSLKRHSTDWWRDLHPASVFFFQFLRDYGFLEYFLTLTGWWSHYSNDLIVHYHLLGLCFDFFFNIDKMDVLSKKEIDPSEFLTIANFSPLPPSPTLFFF